MTDHATRGRVSRQAAELQRCRFSVDQASDAVFWLDREGRFTYVNDRACRSLGYSRDELLSLSLRDIDPDCSPARLAADWMAHEVGEPVTIRMETCHRRKDGSEFPVDVWSTHTWFGDQEFHVVFARDITERRRADAERARLETELRQRQKMEAIGRVAGAVAHDFRNLLTVISGYADLVADGLGPANPHVADLEQMKRACDHAGRLVKDLLAFSRSQQLRPVSVCPNEALASLEPMLRRMLGAAVGLDSSYGRGIGRIRVDPHQLAQVLMNLAANARDVMPAGGRMTLRTTAVVVPPGVVRDGAVVEPRAYVVITVADTGIGMDAATRVRVFEPFFTTKPEGQGTGLGLSTVYGIVKQSGGYVWVTSEPGHGTQFEIYFPCIDAVREDASQPEVPPSSPTPSTGF
jgi:two-component system, cell cycle sensor histidine kinase and response regulator CckA